MVQYSVFQSHDRSISRPIFVHMGLFNTFNYPISLSLSLSLSLYITINQIHLKVNLAINVSKVEQYNKHTSN